MCTCNEPTCTKITKVTAYSFLGAILPYCIISFATAKRNTKMSRKSLNNIKFVVEINNLLPIHKYLEIERYNLQLIYSFSTVITFLNQSRYWHGDDEGY